MWSATLHTLDVIATILLPRGTTWRALKIMHSRWNALGFCPVRYWQNRSQTPLMTLYNNNNFKLLGESQYHSIEKWASPTSPGEWDCSELTCSYATLPIHSFSTLHCIIDWSLPNFFGNQCIATVKRDCYTLANTHETGFLGFKVHPGQERFIGKYDVIFNFFA